MKKKLLLLSALLFILSSSFATHNRGGEITYRHVSGLEYEITITTYTKTSAPADRPTLDSVHYGDGTMGQFIRSSKISLTNDISVNKYINKHTYPGSGTYRILMEDSNRDLETLNIPNPVNTPFSIESYLVINPILPACHNSVEFFDIPIFTAQKFKFYVQNVAVNNPDHDSLSFELVTCLGAGGMPIPGYWLPNAISIDPFSGQVTWKLFNDSVGEYSFAVRIKQWWNGYMIGSVIRDYQIVLIPDLNPVYSFNGTASLVVDTSGNYLLYVNPLDTVRFNLSYADSFGSTLNIFGEAMLMPDKPLVTITNGSTVSTASFLWVPDSFYARPYPYIFTFRGSDTDRRRDLTVLVYVNGKSANPCFSSLIAVPEIAATNEKEIFIYPNPAGEMITIKGKWGFTNSVVSVYDMFGKKIKEENKVLNDQITINTSDFASRIYFVQMTDNNSVLTAKFVKE